MACEDRFNKGIYECPCSDGCPNGCPCPVYQCPTPGPQLESVLVLYYENKALMTSVAGDVTEFDWSTDGEVDSLSLCSLTFHNEMFIYGQVLTNGFLTCCLVDQKDQN